MELFATQLRAALSSNSVRAFLTIVCVVGGLCAASAIGQAAAREPASKSGAKKLEVPVAIDAQDGELLHAMAVVEVPVAEAKIESPTPALVAVAIPSIVT